MFEVEIDFAAQDPRFRQNMTAYMTIETGQGQGVLAAPFEAVFRKDGEQASERAGEGGGASGPGPALVGGATGGNPRQFTGGGAGAGGGGGVGSRGGGGGGGGRPAGGGGVPSSGGNGAVPNDYSRFAGGNGSANGGRSFAAGGKRNGWFVVLRDADGDVREVPVRLGLDDGNYVQLLAPGADTPPEGIEPGAELLLRDPSKPTPRF
jgi:hypothetical protein